MTQESRPIFKRPTELQKYFNRFSLVTRGVIIMLTVLTITRIPEIKEGLDNFNNMMRKEMWIVETANDPTIGEFTNLDDEEPPRPLPKNPELARFRAKFAKLRQRDSES